MANPFEDLMKKLVDNKDNSEANSPILQHPGVVENAPIQQPSVFTPPHTAVTQSPDKRVETLSTPDYELPKNFQARQVTLPEESAEEKNARIQRYNGLISERNNLKDNFKKDLDDAKSRNFKSEIFAALGNYLPGVIAGATAMNTHASVKPAEVPQIVAKNDVGLVTKKYETDYEKLIKELKDVKGGGEIDAKTRAFIANANADRQARADSMNNNSTISEKNLNLRKDKMDRLQQDAFQREASGAVKDLRQTDNWKTAEKQLGEIPGLRMLIKDATEKGGNSLAMLGPKIAKGLAGEVGQMTEGDVTRYVQNPSLVGKYRDSINKLASGKLSEATAEDLNRLIELSEKVAKDKMNSAVHREAVGFSRRQNIPVEDARYFLDQDFNNSNRAGTATKEYAINKDSHSPEATTNSVGPYGETFTKDNKNYKWNAQAGKYQLAN